MAEKKHLTYDERCLIEKYLTQKNSIREIARILNHSPSTIQREIKKHTIIKLPKQNDCINRRDCRLKGVCGAESCDRPCKRCNRCKHHCLAYKREYCRYKKKGDALCNGCVRVKNCCYERRFYTAETAQNEYRETLSLSRTGFDLTCQELTIINDLVSPRIRQGQSPYHIIQTLGDELPTSETTLRRLIHNSELDVKNIDMRAVVQRRPRNKINKRKMKKEISAKIKIGRHYEDYLRYIDENDVNVVQMDCVEGLKTDNAVILTLHFPNIHLQLAFIMEYHTSKCVTETLNKIESALGPELFASIFEVILTDNGHEFMDIEGMERSVNGGRRTRIFFCEPNRSDEKGSCENNHKLIRYVIPKHTSLESFSQFDMNLMMNHINSYSRKSLFGKSPYSMAKNILPADFFILLGLEEIDANEINLTPSLFIK